MNFFDFSKLDASHSLPYEDIHLEYKTASWKLPDNFWDTVGAFANTSGGLIVLGIDEPEKRQYKIVGVDCPDDVITQLFNDNNNEEIISKPILNNGDIKRAKYNGKELIQILVHPEEYNSRPVYVRSVAFTRTDDGDRHATQEQLKYFTVEHQGQIDTRLLPNFNLNDDLNLEDIKKYKEELYSKTNDSSLKNKPLDEFVKDLGVFRRSRTSSPGTYELTEGGLLFFGNYIAITDRFPRFQIDYMRYKTDSAIDWEDRVSTGDMNFSNLNIYSFYKIVKPKLEAGISDKYSQDDKLSRESYYADLKLAAKEALVNSLMHAYYDGNVPIKIIDRPSYFEFVNPGDMRVSKESFLRGQTSIVRNSQIALLFRKIGISEKAASGGPRILRASSKNHLLEPNIKIDYELNTTTLRIWKVDALTYIDEKFKLDNIEKFILKFANSNGIFKFPDLMKATHGEYGSNSKVRTRLNKLLKNDILTKFGEGKSRRYMLKKTKEQKRVGRMMLLKEMENFYS